MADEPELSSDVEDALQDHRSGGSDNRGTLALSDDEGYVGDTITFKGRNLPANERFEIEWYSTNGRWGIIEGNEIVGPQYARRTEVLATVQTDESGDFDFEWEVREDYGGSHRIDLKTENGEVVDRAEFEIRPWFEINRTEAPLGETFTLSGYGIGPSIITNNYQVSWDNGTMGFMTGVTNRGTATAEVRAVGPPGEHVIDVWRSYRGFPYLQNNTQSPYGSVGGDRQSRWTVEVTEPETEPDTAWLDAQYEESPLDIHYPDLDVDTDAELHIWPQHAQAGEIAFITGNDFPPNTEVDLIWYHHDGHRMPKGPDESPDLEVTPEPRPDVLPTATSDDDGEFQVEFEIPESVGSTRPITAMVDGKEVAVTGFMMQPSISSYGPTEGPVGTEIEIDLTGVGWTNYENAPVFVYDNKPLGYVCGTGGNDGLVRAEIPATGEPGWHFIDVYPSLFHMREDEPEFVLRAHLSYWDNHPGRPLPAYHFAFKVTE